MMTMSSLEKLQPAARADVIVYLPYYPKDKHNWLPHAISLYQQGSLEGERNIEGGDSIPFVASWQVSKLPSELTSCRLQFDGQGELSYELTLLNDECIDYLIDVIINFERSRSMDFPHPFYRKLLRFDV